MHKNASAISLCVIADQINFTLYIILISVIEGEIDINLIEAIQWQTSCRIHHKALCGISIILL